jgi:hypothetical protein
MLRYTGLIIIVGLLSACGGSNETYRGVSPQIWGQLTPEQKQLIIDKSYQHALHGQAGDSE